MRAVISAPRGRERAGTGRIPALTADAFASAGLRPLVYRLISQRGGATNEAYMFTSRGRAT